MQFLLIVKSENIPKAYYNYKKVGQLYNYFSSSESIYKRILLRYKQNKTSIDYSLESLLIDFDLTKNSDNANTMNVIRMYIPNLNKSTS